MVLLQTQALKLALWAEEQFAPRNLLWKKRKVTLSRYIFVLLLLGAVAHARPPNLPTTKHTHAPTHASACAHKPHVSRSEYAFQ